MEIVASKRCPGCGEVKPRQAFAHNRAQSDGLEIHCRICRRAIDHTRHMHNKERHLSDPVTVITGEKRCPRCDEVKPASDFYRAMGKRDGVATYCNLCARKVRLVRYRERLALEIPDDAVKQCKRCGQTKLAWQFYRLAGTADNLMSACIECNLARQNTVYRDNVMRQRYGITIAQYNWMLEVQGGVCAICGQPETVQSRTGRTKRLAIDHDHDHVANEIRGLLCHRCNTGIGALRHNPDLLRKAIRYLERGPKRKPAQRY